MKLETKRHNVNFYFAVALLFLFCALGTFLISMFFDEEQKTKEGDIVYLFFAFGVLFVAFAFYTAYQYLKNVPNIIIEKNRIFFNKETFSINDIQHINLTGKMPFRYIGRYPMEGCYIEFKNGKEKFIYDDMYSNIWEIKDYLKQVVVDKKEYQPSRKQEIKPSQVRNEHFEYYKNRLLLSFMGISFWFFCLMFLFIIVQGKSSSVGVDIFLMFYIVLIYFFGSRLFHYYGLSKNYLIIKNFNMPWKKRVYRLEDIIEIVFETEQKRPNGLRVITKNYESKLYFGATLYDNTWRELKKNLRKKDIKVRDECIDYEY